VANLEKNYFIPTCYDKRGKEETILPPPPHPLKINCISADWPGRQEKMYYDI
jgi:hypothetical protein